MNSKTLFPLFLFLFFFGCPGENACQDACPLGYDQIQYPDCSCIPVSTSDYSNLSQPSECMGQCPEGWTEVPFPECCAPPETENASQVPQEPLEQPPEEIGTADVWKQLYDFEGVLEYSYSLKREGNGTSESLGTASVEVSSTQLKGESTWLLEAVFENKVTQEWRSSRNLACLKKENREEVFGRIVMMAVACPGDDSNWKKYLPGYSSRTLFNKTGSESANFSLGSFTASVYQVGESIVWKSKLAELPLKIISFEEDGSFTAELQSIKRS